jgi:hypothetical protein
MRYRDQNGNDWADIIDFLMTCSGSQATPTNAVRRS